MTFPFSMTRVYAGENTILFISLVRCSGCQLLHTLMGEFCSHYNVVYKKTGNCVKRFFNTKSNTIKRLKTLVYVFNLGFSTYFFRNLTNVAT